MTDSRTDQLLRIYGITSIPVPPYTGVNIPEPLRDRPFDRLPPGIQRRVAMHLTAP